MKKRVAYREKPEWEKAIDNFNRSLRRRMKRIKESEIIIPVENLGPQSFYLVPLKKEENEEEVFEDV